MELEFAAQPAMSDFYSFDCWSPIHDKGLAIAHLKGIEVAHGRLCRELELHRRLSLEAHPLPKAGKRRNGVEQPSRARGDRRVNSLSQHFSHDPQLILREITDWRKVRAPQRIISPDLKKNAQGGSARLPDCHLPARQAELTKPRRALEGLPGGEQKFTAPDRSVRAVTGAIPGNSQRGRFDFILRHAGEHMRPVMLDRVHARRKPPRMLCREILGVQIARDDLRLRLPQLREVL